MEILMADNVSKVSFMNNNVRILEVKYGLHQNYDELAGWASCIDDETKVVKEVRISIFALNSLIRKYNAASIDDLVGKYIDVAQSSNHYDFLY